MKKIKLNQIKFVAAVAMCGLFVSCPIMKHPTSLVLLESMAMTRQSQCTIQTGGSSQYLKTMGILDLSLTNHYFLFPHLYNNLPSSMEINGSDAASLDVESNYINIVGAHVRLDIPMDIYNDKNANQSILYSAMTSGYFVGSAGGILPDTDAMSSLEVLPVNIGRELKKVFKARIKADNCSAPAADLFAYVNMDGVTVTGSKVESNTYMFPIKLCWGCLVRYVTDNPTDSIPKSNSAPCLPGQDDAVTNVLCVHIAPPMDQDICYPDRSCAGGY